MEINMMAEDAPTSATIEESDLLAVCPFCGYRLDGLPARRACPECGQLVDRRSREFGGQNMMELQRQRSKGHAFLAMLMPWVMGLQILLGVIFIRRLFEVGGFRELEGYMGLVFILSSSVQIWTWYRHPSKFFMVGPEDLAVCDRRKRTQKRYSWDRVGEAYRLNSRISFDIQIDGRRHTFSIGAYGVLPNLPKEGSLVEHMKQMQQQKTTGETRRNLSAEAARLLISELESHRGSCEQILFYLQAEDIEKTMRRLLGHPSILGCWPKAAAINEENRITSETPILTPDVSDSSGHDEWRGIVSLAPGRVVPFDIRSREETEDNPPGLIGPPLGTGRERSVLYIDFSIGTGVLNVAYDDHGRDAWRRDVNTFYPDLARHLLGAVPAYFIIIGEEAIDFDVETLNGELRRQGCEGWRFILPEAHPAIRQSHTTPFVDGYVSLGWYV